MEESTFLILWQNSLATCSEERIRVLGRGYCFIRPVGIDVLRRHVLQHYVLQNYVLRRYALRHYVFRRRDLRFVVVSLPHSLVNDSNTSGDS